MAYRALYREWRPKDFSHVVGQKAIIDTLRNQVLTERIAHAYLFCGSRGTGKTSTAKILAKAINCLNPGNGDPCGQCENCRRMDQEETLDIIEIDAASNNGVDEMRDLRDTVKYPPQYGKYKVYIIDEVHMLSTSAFNALLKTLEEPPAHVVFILATTEPQKLPETILSRCQRFDFGRLSVSEITGRLREAAEGCGAQVSDGALMLIARAADGGMRDALSILDMCLGYRDQISEELVRSILGTSDNAFLFQFCEAFSGNDPGRIFRYIDDLMKDGRDPAVFAKDVCRHIRALLIAKTSPEGLAKLLDITDEEAGDLIRQGGCFTLSRLIYILDSFMALETGMRYTSTPRLALESAAVKCCLSLEGTDLQALTDRMTELEKKVASLAAGMSGGTSGTPPAEESTRNKPDSVSPRTPRNEPTAPAVSGDKRQIDDSAAWKEMMIRIQKTDIAAWSFLSQGNLVSARDHQYVWQANSPEGEKQFVSALNKPEKQRVIMNLLSEITGHDCGFTASERGSASKAAEQGEDAFLNRIYETFGREKVQVVDSLT